MEVVFTRDNRAATQNLGPTDLLPIIDEAGDVVMVSVRYISELMICAGSTALLAAAESEEEERCCRTAGGGG